IAPSDFRAPCSINPRRYTPPLSTCTGRFIAGASTSTPNASSRSATTNGASTRSLTPGFASLTVTIIAPHVGNQTREGFAATRANSYNRTNKALLTSPDRPQVCATPTDDKQCPHPAPAPTATA